MSSNNLADGNWKRLSAEQKIKAVKIILQENRPFFSYSLLNMVERRMDSISTMGVNKYGRLFYNEDFVNDSSLPDLAFYMCHEVMHCLLFHLRRIGGRNPRLWNVSADVQVNTILEGDDFAVPKGCLVVDGRGDFTLHLPSGDIVVEKAGDKCAERIYDDLYKQLKDEKGDDGSSGSGDGKSGDGKGDGQFDTHLFDNDEGRGENGIDSDEENENFWKGVFSEAVEVAKSRGDLPSSIERFFNGILNPKLSWRSVIRKSVIGVLPSDFSWKKPSRKSVCSGYYLPSILRESAEVVVAVDTSGSIDQEEGSMFVSEMVGLAKSIRNLKMTILVCDSKIHGVYDVKNGNIQKILSIKFEGGGGTSHLPVFDWVKSNSKKAKLLVCFTDGFTRFPKAEEVPRNLKVLWVVPSGRSADVGDFPFGRVVKVNK
jgi:predicted metal-dependent peptidase